MTKRTLIPTWTRLFLIAPVSMMNLTQVAAQDGGEGSSVRQLEEVVVTARKRTESLADVPMSVTALLGENLQTGIGNMTDLGKMVPSVHFEKFDRSRPVLYIRGIGTRAYDAGSDPSVGVFIDGVHRGRFSGLTSDLVDIERIEVLKGPQGTLYGRNTIGGAISVITGEPTYDFYAKVQGEVGVGETDSDDLFNTGFVLSGPLVEDKLAGRITGSYRERDGYAKTIENSRRVAGEESLYLDGKLVWDATDDLRLKFAVDYNNMEEPEFVVHRNPVPDITGVYEDSEAKYAAEVLLPGTEIPPIPGDPYTTRGNNLFDTYWEAESYGAAVHVNWDLGSIDLTSITAYRESEIDEFNDLEQTGLDTVYNPVTEDAEQFSQELRLYYEADSYNVLLGLFYLDETVDRHDGLYWGLDTQTAALGGGRHLWDFGVDLDSTSFAAFTQVEFLLTDRTRLMIGGRYTEDEKDADIATTFGPFPFLNDFATNEGDTWDSFDPMASLSFDVNDDVMTYLTYSSGFKSGAFQFFASTIEMAQQVVDPEEVDLFEVGLKGSFLERRLNLNLSAFYMDYKDLQLLRVVPAPDDVPGARALVVISNAAKSINQGIEVEGSAILGDNFALDFGYTYLDAEFDEYQFNEVLDFSDNRLPRSPEHAFRVALKYSESFGFGDIDANLAYSWQDDIYFEADNNTIDLESDQDAYGVIDASVSLIRGPFTVSLWGTNLADETYLATVLNSTGRTQRQVYAAPRTMGLKLVYEFN